MLIPLIESWVAFTTESGERVGVIVTIFSESAEGALKKFAVRASQKGAGYFSGALLLGKASGTMRSGACGPDFFVTARYEAWPELWMSFRISRFPCSLRGQGAKLFEMGQACLLLGGVAYPKISFVRWVRKTSRRSSPVSGSDASRIRGIRGGRECGSALIRGNTRAREITEEARALSRPWGVLGSFWAEDLKIWDGVIRGTCVEGNTLDRSP